MDSSTYVDTVNGKDVIFGKEVLQLKSNRVPKGLVSLERAFDNKDKAFYASTDKTNDLEEVNLGTRIVPKKVYIGKCLSPRTRKNLIDLLRKFRHVFAWSDEDLKAYREDLFQHEIPLKEGTKPFR